MDKKYKIVQLGVTYPPSYWRIAKILGSLRSTIQNEHNGLIMTDSKTDVIGVMGELITDLWMRDHGHSTNQRNYIYDRELPGADLFIGDYGIDVKTVRQNHQFLQVNISGHEKAKELEASTDPITTHYWFVHLRKKHSANIYSVPFDEVEQWEQVMYRTKVYQLEI